MTTTDDTPEVIWPLIWGGNSDKKCWELSAVEKSFKDANALPATIYEDKGFNSVDIKSTSQLSIEVPTKTKKNKKIGVCVCVHLL